MMDKIQKCSGESSYPLFESNQILTSTHLNELRLYLDHENRGTRVKLSGNGIICGLEPAFQTASKKIEITRGYGVSTDGYFIGLDEKTVHGKYKVYTSPEDPVYPPWTKNETQIKLWEIFPDNTTVQGIKPLNKFHLNEGGEKLDDKVVVLFLEANEEELKSCTGTTCDNKGKRRHLTVKVLLVKEGDLDEILLEDLLKIQENLQELNIQRLSSQIDLSQTTKFNQIATGYQKIFNSYKIKIAETILKAHGIYAGFFGLKDLDLKPVKDLATMTFNKEISQYQIGLLKDLILAYHQFRDTALAFTRACCLAKAEFPRHLMLGKVMASKKSEIEPYRNYFIQAPLSDNHDRKALEAQWLFQGILSMLAGFEVAPSTNATIKVTPSREDETLLSQRSIPYYYKNAKELFLLWDPELELRDKSKYQLSYWENQYNTSPQIPHVHEPLRYDIDEYPFFRIEGHLGGFHGTVIDELNKLRQGRNLPFDIVALKLSPKAEAVILQDDCGWRDLQMDYMSLRSEVISSLQALTAKVKKHEQASLAMKLITIMTNEIRELSLKINALLPQCVTEFQFSEFHKVYVKLIQLLIAHKLALKHFWDKLIHEKIDLLDPQDFQDQANLMEEWIDDIDSFLDPSRYAQLLTLYTLYAWRIQEMKKAHLSIFSNFVKKYPGLEHHAGVPKGGTFIVVYNENAKNPNSPDHKILADFTLPYRIGDCCCELPACEEDKKTGPILFPPVAGDDGVEVVKGKEAVIAFKENDYSLHQGGVKLKDHDKKS